MEVGSLGCFILLVGFAYPLIGIWEAAMENFGEKKDEVYRLALLFGLFAAVSTTGDWYLNAPFAFRPIDEGEL